MNFTLPVWIYDLTIIVYAVSLHFYFSDLIDSSNLKKRMAIGLLYVVWTMQTVFFVGQIMEHQNEFSFATMFMTLFFYAWMMLTLSIIIHRFVKMEVVVFVIHILTFIVCVINLFSAESIGTSMEAAIFRDELIFIHVVMAISSYIAFTVSAVLAICYLWFHRQLKRKQWSNLLRRLPDLTRIEKYMLVSVLWGLPLLVINVLLVIIWNFQQSDFIQWNDPKIWNTLIVALAYTYFIYRKFSRTATSIQLAWYNLIAMTFVLLNYLLSNWLSDFHNWVWYS